MARCRRMQRWTRSSRSRLVYSSPWQKSSRHSTVPASRRTALLSAHILPVCSLIAPCPAGAGTVSVLARLSPRTVNRSGDSPGRAPSLDLSRFEPRKSKKAAPERGRFGNAPQQARQEIAHAAGSASPPAPSGRPLPEDASRKPAESRSSWLRFRSRARDAVRKKFLPDHRAPR